MNVEFHYSYHDFGTYYEVNFYIYNGDYRDVTDWTVKFKASPGSAPSPPSGFDNVNISVSSDGIVTLTPDGMSSLIWAYNTQPISFTLWNTEFLEEIGCVVEFADGTKHTVSGSDNEEEEETTEILNLEELTEMLDQRLGVITANQEEIQVFLEEQNQTFTDIKTLSAYIFIALCIFAVCSVFKYLFNGL